MKGFSTNHPFLYDITTIAIGFFIGSMAVMVFHKVIMPRIPGLASATKPATATS